MEDASAEVSSNSCEKIQCWLRFLHNNTTIFMQTLHFTIRSTWKQQQFSSTMYWTSI